MSELMKMLVEQYHILRVNTGHPAVVDAILVVGTALIESLDSIETAIRECRPND